MLGHLAVGEFLPGRPAARPISGFRGRAFRVLNR
jgi:hypothetical protein